MGILIDGRTIQDHFPGIARYTYNLTRAMVNAAPAQEFVVLYAPAALNTRYDLMALKQSPNVRLVAGAAHVSSLREQWHIPRQVRLLAPTLIHFPYYLHPYRLPTPVVFTALDLIPLKFPQYYPPHERLIFRVAMTLAINTARRIIAISAATASDVQRAFSVRAGRLTPIPLAADPTFFPQGADRVEATRRTYHLPERYGLFFASNKPHKNLMRLVEAWAPLAKRVMPLKLVIAGHWDERYPQAKERAEALGLTESLLFIGPIPEADLPGLYSGAEWFIFPSLYEGFGLPIVEAMACGTPVACADAPGLTEAAGNAALLFDPRNVEAITHALATTLNDSALRADLQERGLRRARELTWARVAEATLRVYEECAS